MKIVRVNHVGVIVADRAGAIDGFSRLLGIPLEHSERYGSELGIDFLPCGDTQLEIIEPLTDGASAAYLRRYGAGIQHIAFEVEDLDACLTELASGGVEPLGEAPRPGAGNTRIAFLDPARFGGILVELCQMMA